MAWSQDDVITSAQNGAAMNFNNGTAITHTNIHGTSQFVGPSGTNGLGGYNRVEASGEINGRLYDRFDDITYYTT